MIYGIGVDMVDIRRISGILNRWGDRFVHRVFTATEIAYCSRMAHPASRYALRFAAKEAFAKALGLGFRDGLRFHHIEVVKNALGMPSIQLYDRSKELCDIRSITKSFLSLTDDGRYGVAMVVLESLQEGEISCNAGVVRPI